MDENTDFDRSMLARSQLAKIGIQQVLDIDGITEVAINEPGKIWFDRGDGWEFKDEQRCSFEQCMRLANSLSVFSNSGDVVGASNPIQSVVLPDGQRGQIVLPPATIQQCVSMTIRKPSDTRFTLGGYVETNRLSGFSLARKKLHDLTEYQKKMLKMLDQQDMERFFQTAVDNHLNILLVGGTGSGKTTFMKAVADLYPHDRRIFTIEDVHELNLPYHPNHLHLFYHKDGVKPKQIIEACMRMKPDHVFLAELRGDEAWNYIEMLNTGHSGSITTTHANDCYSAFSRIAALVKQSEIGQTLDYNFILNTIKSSIDIVCFFKHSYMKEIYFNPEEKNSILSSM